MTRMRIATALAVLCTAGFAHPAAAQSEAQSEFESFRIPRHSWFAWAVNLNGNGNTQSNSVPDHAAREGRVAGTLFTSASWNLDSDEFQRRLSVGAGTSGSRRHVERTDTDSISRRTSELSQNDALERLSLDGSIRLYPWSVPLGFDLFGFGNVDFSQSRAEVNDAQHAGIDFRSNHRVEDDQSATSVGATITIGLGRVRDATVVYRTHLLEQRLRDTGNLTRALSEETRRKLAALFYVGSGFSVPHDRPDKFFWREVERILREDGALDPGSLDAYAVFRLLEPAIEGQSFFRNVGFFIGPTASVYDQQSLRRSSLRSELVASLGDSVLNRFVSTGSDRRYFHNANASVGARAEYHRPLGMKWQIDANSGVQFVDRHHFLLVGSNGILSYQMADRWFADAMVVHNWNRTGAGQPEEHDTWSLTYGGDLVYFLEDAWRVGLSWSAGQSHEPDRVTHVAEVTLGITYQIAGIFEAPGIVEPVRMLRR